MFEPAGPIICLFVFQKIFVVVVLNAVIFDLQIFENARAGVAKDFVGGGQKAGGLAVAEHADQVRVRFVVAIVDAIGSRPVAAEANVVANPTEIGEFDVQALAVRAGQRPRAELANEFSFSVYAHIEIHNFKFEAAIEKRRTN
jgi:hypothetical protein